MQRLDFHCDKWHLDKDAPLRSATMMNLPDFRGMERECWHLRGRGWRWVLLRSTFQGLAAGEEYELCFWAKIDYYSGRGTRCYIDLYEADNWEGRLVYDIMPNCPSAVVESGEWILYRFKIPSVRTGELIAQISSFEANIAVMQAFPGDEEYSDNLQVSHSDSKEPFIVNHELPFREYASLEQRIAKYYSDLLAPYYPCDTISQESQREYYEFVKEIYDKLYTEPQGFFRELHEDDAHPNRFNNSEYGKPDLKRYMKNDRAKIEELFELLLDLGKTGDLTEGNIHIKSDISRKQKTLLTYMGFELSNGILLHIRYNRIGEAIKYLADKENALHALMYCWFDASYSYLEKTFAKHYDMEQYDRLVNWLRSHGYQWKAGSGTSPTLDYYKGITKKESEVGYAIHGDKNHYGFTFEFRAEPRVMQHCEPRIIQFGQMLKRFDDLSENTRFLILQRTKRCDKCRYCIQTDKTGKRPFAAIIINENTVLCPYYPGFNYTFEKLTKFDVDCIIAFLTDLEKSLSYIEK